MKNKLLLLVSLLSISVMTAQTITPKNWVTDLGDLYTPEQEANLNSIISAYEKQTSIEIGVITIESLNGESIEEFANEQFNKIGIGKKGADNGILIVFSKNDKKSRIETGNGMEPFLSDLDTHEALQVIKPYFRAGDYATGTVDCVNFIKNKLGNEAFANKVKWLKEKEAKEAKESAAAWESFKSGLIKFVLVACFIGILVFIYFLDKARREKIRLEQERLRLEEERKQKVRANIVSAEKVIKSTSVNTPSINSAILQSSYNSVDAYIKSLNIKQGTDGDDAYLSKLSNIKNTLISKINAYDRLVNDIKSKMNKIDSLDYAISDAKNYNKEALNALTEIKRYGYNKDYTDLASSIDKLGVIANTITNNTVKTDVDKAIVDAENLKGNIAYLTSKSGEVIDYLRSIKNAESKIKTSDSVFNTVLSNINRYNSYLKPNELDKVVTEYNNFKRKSNTNDFLAYALLFASTLAIAEALLSKVRGRKEDEEAEARRIVEAARRKKQEEEDRARRKRQQEEDDDRRRRDSYSSSYSSSSSSSSSSDFGGFGGGSSSGGGSSDGW
jgi:uncharacterized membrane protein YgcG